MPDFSSYARNDAGTELRFVGEIAITEYRGKNAIH
jgi:hypothetical protein